MAISPDQTIALAVLAGIVLSALVYETVRWSLLLSGRV